MAKSAAKTAPQPKTKSAVKSPAKAAAKTAGKTSGKAATKKQPAGKKPAAAVKPYAMVANAAGGPEVFTRQELELPKPGKGEVLVAQKAIGLNFIDVYQR